MPDLSLYNPDDATHELACAHWRWGKHRVREYQFYTRRCILLKVMGDGRAKVVVFGYRSVRGMESVRRIRYVPSSRLCGIYSPRYPSRFWPWKPTGSGNRVRR